MKLMQKSSLSLVASIAVFAIPVAAFAQSALPSSGYCSDVNLGQGIVTASSTASDVIKYITCFITQSIVPLIFALATAVFVWGVVKFIQAGDSSEAREQGRQFMIWGIVALAVMISVWGLVSILGTTFNTGNVLPSLPVDKVIK